jgi:hypothetical protein
MITIEAYDHDKLRLESRKLEEEIFLSAMSDMYQTSLQENSILFDIAAALTSNFEKITPKAIIADSRIIKTIRYSVAPSISQMKFGQFFGLNSIACLENRRVTRGSAFSLLTSLAPRISQFAQENLDRRRFPWTAGLRPFTAELLMFAKLWTSSIAADQNAQTAYRNWRKNEQERKIRDFLLGRGYQEANIKGLISSRSDIEPGEFTTEIKVKGRTRQKADVVARSRSSGELVLIEAKAVGVELDATKRIKECCDKANDWRTASELGTPSVVAFIAGFFTSTNISNLQASGVHVVWEHHIAGLQKII